MAVASWPGPAAPPRGRLKNTVSLLPIVSNERGELVGAGSILVAILLSCQDMTTCVL